MSAAKQNVTVVLMAGGWRAGGVEGTLRLAGQAAGRDLLQRLLATGRVSHVVVATDDVEWTRPLASLPITVDPDPSGDFHFGQRLAMLIRRHDIERLLYCGAGSAPLMSEAQWADVLETLCETDRLVVTNNLHSADWFAVNPTDEALSIIRCQQRDNGLPWLLNRQRHFPVKTLPPSAATRFDLDTPMDLLIAGRHQDTGAALRATLARLPWDSARVDALLTVMAREGGHLTLIGRVSSAAWGALERATRCWTRVFSEERGMRASGRQESGQVCSLLAAHIAAVGLDSFFAQLATMTEGVLFDTRVILAARGLWPSSADRFHADLGEWEAVEEPFLREMTRAATSVSIPILMGGHAVVSGGLLALVEILNTSR